MDSIKEERIRRWSVIREKGQMRFILVYGALAWGLSVGILFSLLEWLLEPGFDAKSDIPTVMIAFLLGGVGFGWWIWKKNEKLFQSAPHNSASKP
ncbi:MAG: hypothetical protein Q7T25_03265 [Sideroxyarcus sp.]|nr:hypothetical protein [Sideroxyarcus sp.]